ncbi:MAG TPA: hypothetical protein VHH73_05600 [Verrucomicrobiae bacterium]|nr:hypothetical protein [Verrucomicrobiae bacterium]
MKILKHLPVAVVAVALVKALSATAADLPSGSVQSGQGGAVTFFKSSTPKAGLKRANQARDIRGGVKWARQGIPNGSAVTYAVPEQPRLEIAPLK